MKFNDEPFPIDLDAPKSVPCSEAFINEGDNSWIAMLLMLALLSERGE